MAFSKHGILWEGTCSWGRGSLPHVVECLEIKLSRTINLFLAPLKQVGAGGRRDILTHKAQKIFAVFRVHPKWFSCPRKWQKPAGFGLNWREDYRDPVVIDGWISSWGPQKIDYVRRWNNPGNLTCLRQPVVKSTVFVLIITRTRFLQVRTLNIAPRAVGLPGFSD